MFASLEDAVRACRAAYREHHAARDRRDDEGMVAAADRIGIVVDHLRALQRADLIFPLTMEWATEGRDAVEHARYRAKVDDLLRVAHPR